VVPELRETSVGAGIRTSLAPGASGAHGQSIKGTAMTRSIALLAGGAIIPASLSGQVFSQGAPQTISLMKEVRRGALQRT